MPTKQGEITKIHLVNSIIFHIFVVLFVITILR